MTGRYSEECSSDELASFIKQNSKPRGGGSRFLRWARISFNVLLLVLLVAILGLLIQLELKTDFGEDVNRFVPRCE